MVVYFSRSGKTEVFAKVLSSLRSMVLFELRSDLNRVPTMRFVLRAMWLTARKRSVPVAGMPGELPKEIYVCSPVWGGHVAPPVRFFFQNARLSDVTVNILLTASMPTLKYVRNAEKFLQGVDCIPGKVWIFATSKELPDAEAIEEQMKEIM